MTSEQWEAELRQRQEKKKANRPGRRRVKEAYLSAEILNALQRLDIQVRRFLTISTSCPDSESRRSKRMLVRS
jgi:hypothetical protein